MQQAVTSTALVDGVSSWASWDDKRERTRLYKPISLQATLSVFHIRHKIRYKFDCDFERPEKSALKMNIIITDLDLKWHNAEPHKIRSYRVGPYVLHWKICMTGPGYKILWYACSVYSMLDKYNKAGLRSYVQFNKDTQLGCRACYTS